MNALRWVAVGAALVLLCWAVGGRKRLAGLRLDIARSWEAVQNLCAQRRDAVVRLVQGLRGHEGVDARMLDAVLAAGVQAQVAAQRVARRPSAARAVTAFGWAQEAYERAVFRLFAVLDAPSAESGRGELQEQARQAADDWRATEAELVERRQRFNQAVASYNAAAAEMPTWILSRLFGFAPAGPW